MSMYVCRCNLAEGMELLIHRYKLIKLADRSKSGWAVVVEYEDGELADNSEDKKRMEKVERQEEDIPKQLPS